RRDVGRLTQPFNVGGGFLVVASAFQILQVLASGGPPALAAGEGIPETQENNKPDIYYIILDGYGRQDVLKDLYGFDNSDFIQFLQSRGFYVADQARANYCSTVPSLASSLNRTYLTGLAARYG